MFIIHSKKIFFLWYLLILFSLEQSVEWLYSFDVHCNAFFPVFLLLYVLQFILWPLLLSENFVAALAGNSLHLVALAFYWHVTFHGYNALPFLQRTVVFVYPIALIIVVYFVALASGTNIARTVLTTRLAAIGVDWSEKKMFVEKKKKKLMLKRKE